MGVAYKNLSMKSEIFLRCIRVDLDLMVNEFKQIGLLIVLLIMNIVVIVCVVCRNE